MQEYFEIGQIVNTFGIKGMVKHKIINVLGSANKA